VFVSGFTFIRNAIKFDYPVVEAILSIEPLCDEIIVAVGNSDDDTLNLIKNINNPKIKIINTIWDESIREGGKVLAIETDKALAAVNKNSDWCIYIQGDEVLHEDGYNNLQYAMNKYKDDNIIDGLLLKYRHFYGSYDYIADTTRWYRREIRIIKPNRNIYSYGDAQGFRKDNNLKLNVSLVDAYIHHYGWVKKPTAMQGKQETFHKLWHDDNWVEENIANSLEFDYSGIESLDLFKGKHPAFMIDRINNRNWKFDFDISIKKLKMKERIRKWIEKMTGWRIGEYKNYKLIKDR